MARLRDVPTIVREVGLVPFAKRVWFETLDDHLPMFAGTLAYAWLLALFPFVILILNVVPLLPGAGHRGVAVDTSVILHALLPDRLADAVWSNAAALGAVDRTKRSTGLVVLGSLLATLWIASGGVTATMAALDKCYELKQVRAYHKRRPMAFGLTIVMALLAIGVTTLLTTGPAGRQWIADQFSRGAAIPLIFCFDLLRGAIAIGAAMFMVGLMYHFGPCVKRPYRPATPGAIFVMVVWILLGLAFKEYVNRFSGSRYEENYGAAGWVVILLVVLYLDALVLLIGAEINSEMDFAILKVPRGSRNYMQAERARANGMEGLMAPKGVEADSCLPDSPRPTQDSAPVS